MKRVLKSVSRRSFLKSLLVSGASLTVLPGRVLGLNGETSPNSKMALAFAGLNGRGSANLYELRDEQFVAFCDVDMRRTGDVLKNNPKVPFYKDFRQMLEKHGKEIDGVVVSTPDHTHAAILKAALQLGKHVYSEKPLAHSIHEVRTLTRLVEEKKVCSQVGNQGHSFDSIRAFKEWMEDGVIGNIQSAVLMCNSNYSYIKRLDELKEKHDVPVELDWNLWLGPAADRPYHPLYMPGIWRFWRDFGSGVLGDWVCHLADPLFYALGLDYPSAITAHPVEYDPQKHASTFPSSTVIEYEFAAAKLHPAFTLSWYEGKSKPARPQEFEGGSRQLPDMGGLVVGEKGKIVYGSHGAAGLQVLDEERMKSLSQQPKRIPRSPGHQREWALACKGKGAPLSPFSYGGKLSELGLLGTIAMLFPGEKLLWDGPAARFTNNQKANDYLNPPARKGWEV